MKADITGFFDDATYTVSYVVTDPQTGSAAILDPVLDYDPDSGKYSTLSADKILAFVREKNLKVEWILETHVHADHLTASAYLQEQLNAPIGIGEGTVKVQAFFKGFYNAEAEFKTDGSQFDHLFKDGEIFQIGEMEACILATPGHTLACITYVVGDAAFVGDTLFMTDYGTARTDFPGGDANVLYDSIHRLYEELPPETRLFLCHDYGRPERKEFVWETSLAEQRKKNIHVHEGVSKAAFVKLRQMRDKTLAAPRLMLPAIQVNMRAGGFPPKEANGVSYLKIPVGPANSSR
ncbi:MBL fold metallo-hydrolase [Rhodospirillaceae bacterium AH-315-P19]|nr:MBL fold metallo-hydrolase [Rhodospirillaceae bacterium AH-315-P19]